MSFFDEIMYKGFLGYYLEQQGQSSGSVFFLIIVCGALLISACAYLLGSINTSIILSKFFFHEDVRTHGSGNAGATNMLRTYGKKFGAMTLLGDALKAVIAVLIGRLVFGSIGAYLAGVFCMLGHVFPIYYRFKGGKGVVVAAVTVLMTNWKVGLILILFFVILVAATKFVSLGSVMCVLVYPILLSRMLGNDPHLVLLFAFAITIIVVLKHISNIKRLISGTESKISFSKKTEGKSETGNTDK